MVLHRPRDTTRWRRRPRQPQSEQSSPNLTHTPTWMLWYLAPVIAALFVSLRAALGKAALARHHPLVVTLVQSCAASLVLWSAALLHGIPSIAPNFWGILAIAAVLGALCQVLTVIALGRSELSVIGPLRGLSPALVLVAVPLIVGETVPFAGVIGVLVVAGGTYLLKADGSGTGVLAPARALLTDSGVRILLVAILINSVGSSLDRLGIVASSPFFWAAAVTSCWSLLLAPLAARHWRRSAYPSRRRLLWVAVAAGLLGAIGTGAHALAIAHLPVVYAVSLKGGSVMFSVALGGWMFKERSMRHRGVAAGIIALGMIMILLA